MPFSGSPLGRIWLGGLIILSALTLQGCPWNSDSEEDDPQPEDSQEIRLRGIAVEGIAGNILNQRQIDSVLATEPDFTLVGINHEEKVVEFHVDYGEDIESTNTANAMVEVRDYFPLDPDGTIAAVIRYTENNTKITFVVEKSLSGSTDLELVPAVPAKVSPD